MNAETGSKHFNPFKQKRDRTFLFLVPSPVSL